ncbi:MAG: Gfo/Idh/MocA family oxidoreductase [Bacteroidota bacterium]
MKKNFAIVGCGRIASRHAIQITLLANLVAVCDIDPIKASAFAAEFNTTAYFSLEEMLIHCPEIEVVSICTPNYLHANHTIISLTSGKHVLCEKPLSIDIQDAKKMIDTANKFNRKLFVVKQNRYNPPVEAVKSMINNNRLGQITSFQINCFWNRPSDYYTDTWKGNKKLDGGTLFTQFSHFIDLLYWLLGDVNSVVATTQNYLHPEIEIEDAGIVLFKMKSGAIGTLNYNVNAFQKNMEGSFTVFGEKGTVKIGGQYLNTIEYQSLEGQQIHLNDLGNPSNDYGFYQGSMSNHDKVYSNLIAALDDNESKFASAFEGMKSVEIIEMIYASAGSVS